MKQIAAQKSRLIAVQNHDVYVANNYLKATSKAYRNLVATINQLSIDYQGTNKILAVQKPKKSDLERLYLLVDDLDDNISNHAKKRLKMYLTIASLSINFYIQALVGIQSVVLHEEYAKESKKALNQDAATELNFQNAQLNLSVKKPDKVSDEKSNAIWDSNDVMVAAVSSSVLKMLQSRKREQLLKEMMPQYSFRKSTLGGKYEPIKRVGGTLPLNSYFQSEQYIAESIYRTASAKVINQESISAFRQAGIKKVTVVNEFTPCDLCIDYIGVIYDLNDAPEIPFHSHCRCRLMHIDNDYSDDNVALLLGGLAAMNEDDNSSDNIDDIADEASNDVEENGIMKPENQLPNFDKVNFPEQKLTKYALSPESERGKHKAKVFKSALGYDLSNWQELRNQIINNVGNYEAISGESNEYGHKFKVIIPITGPNGATVDVSTAWMVSQDNSTTKLVTLFVK
ncbi:DUF6883 domain-containing protein [Latilactobacillus sp. 5-91]|uniref:DUF6883 domain-containing protein n=1 Tax=Latilactobacillus sp. 5-91 TaxID=3410924 RepID=UPI003C7347F9